jgi:hypothetical protein
MAIIEKTLFSWQELYGSSDLERLALVLATLDDEGLMRKLEEERKRGRDDYPIRAVWNSILAGVVYQHPSLASLRRELLRNGELRQACGFDLSRGMDAVPPEWVYSRFLKKLVGHREEIREICERMVKRLQKELPDYGRYLATDAKALRSYGRPTKKRGHDGRREKDADWGIKTYDGKREDGTTYREVRKWFGFKLHLLVDSTYELPIGWEVTPGSVSESARLRGLIEGVDERHIGLLDRAEELSADKAYDSAGHNTWIWRDYGIKPVIAARDMWKDGEKTRLLWPERAENIVYDAKGGVYCHCPETGERREMAYMGFEKDRETLKYRCPAVAYGLECKGRGGCVRNRENRYGRVVRIALDLDRRIFTPIARSSYAWQRSYNRRTAAERVNSRLDVSFGFERHFIRGLAKMRMRVDIAMVVMLAMAVGRIQQKRSEEIRSLVGRARAA